MSQKVTVTSSDVSTLRNRVSIAMLKGEAPSSAAMEVDHLLRRWFSELVQREDRRTEQTRQKNDPKKEEDEPPRLSIEKEHQDPRTEIQKRREAFRLSLDKLEADAKVENYLKDLRQLVELGCSFLRHEVCLMEENRVHNTRDRVFRRYGDEKVPKNNKDRVFRHHFPFKSEEMEGMSPGVHGPSQKCSDDVKEQKKKATATVTRSFQRRDAKITEEKASAPADIHQKNAMAEEKQEKKQKGQRNSERTKKEEAQSVAMELDNLLDKWKQKEFTRSGVITETQLKSLEDKSPKMKEKKRQRDHALVPDAVPVSSKRVDRESLKTEDKSHDVKIAKEKASACKEVQKNGSKNAMTEEKRKEYRNSERNKKGEAKTIARELDDLLDNWYHEMQQTEPPRFGVPVSEELGSSKRFEEESVKTVENKEKRASDPIENESSAKNGFKKTMDKAKEKHWMKRQSDDEKPSAAVVPGKRRREEAAGQEPPEKRPDTSKTKPVPKYDSTEVGCTKDVVSWASSVAERETIAKAVQELNEAGVFVLPYTFIF